jgi:hypothetical protein
MPDLSQYLGKKVEVVLRSGYVFTGEILRNGTPYSKYPFMFRGNTYTKTGNFWDNQSMSHYDIISIKSIDDKDSCEEMKQELQELRQKVSALQQEIDTLKNAKPTIPHGFSRKDCLKLLDGETSRLTVCYAFRWDKTPQGYQYWQSLTDDVEKGKSLPKEALDYIKDMVILSYRQEQGE